MRHTLPMNYFTFREASEITGLNEATIRRLSKRPESKPYVQMKKGKKGSVYTIQADYLFGIYPRLRFDKNPLSLRIGSYFPTPENTNNQEVIALLAAKDEIIQYLKDEAAYLRNENIRLQEEIRVLKFREAKAAGLTWSRKVMRWASGLLQATTE